MSDKAESKVFWADGDDPRMVEAYARAQSTFKYFWRELAWERRRIVPALDLACVKAPFSDNDDVGANDADVEHLWLSDVDFDGRKIYGTILNSPNGLKSVGEGDEVVISLSEISDWMYAIDAKVYGAYTVNLLREQMGRLERKRHDRAWGLTFGSATRIDVVPSETAVPGLLRRVLGARGAEDAPDPLLLAEREHPASTNMSPKLGDALKENPGMLEEQDDRGWRILHHLALAGSAAGVDVVLKAGADSSAVTNEGQTAHDLAVSIGWPRVAKMLDSHGHN